MPAEPLTASEREEIRAGICRAGTDTQIAERLGRHRSTKSAGLYNGLCEGSTNWAAGLRSLVVSRRT